jgi:hypothetical protein
MRFKLRTMLIAVAELAPLYYVGAKLVEVARREAVWSAYIEGDISHDEAREQVGDIVDSWDAR